MFTIRLVSKTCGKMRLLVLSTLVATLCLQCEARHFERCELVRELRRQGFPEDKMRDWVCLVEHESSRRTDAMNTNNNGSKDYGLFQINDRFWCSNTGAPGKDCNVKCSDLFIDDITKASKCAMKVYKRHKFQAWNGWKDHCQTPGSLPDISSC